MSDIYKYEHEENGNILIKVIGNEFSFFSISSKETYGDRFSFENKEDLIGKINDNYFGEPVYEDRIDAKLPPFEKDTSKGSDVVTYNNISVERLSLADNITTLELNYSPYVRKIVLDHLPKKLVNFIFDPMFATYSIHYSEANGKTIKSIVFKNHQVRIKIKEGTAPVDSIVYFPLPKSIEKLKIIGVNTIFGTRFLTKVFPNLRDIRYTYKDSNEERILFYNGVVTLPKEFNGPLKPMLGPNQYAIFSHPRLRDDIKRIEFEAGSKNYIDITNFLPDKLEYIRLPKGYPFLESIKKKFEKKSTKIEENSV